MERKRRILLGRALNRVVQGVTEIPLVLPFLLIKSLNGGVDGLVNCIGMNFDAIPMIIMKQITIFRGIGILCIGGIILTTGRLTGCFHSIGTDMVGNGVGMTLSMEG